MSIGRNLRTVTDLLLLVTLGNSILDGEDDNSERPTIEDDD